MSPWLARCGSLAEEAVHESRHRALSMTTPELLAYRAAMKRVGGVWRSSAPPLAAPDESVVGLSLCADEAGGEVKRYQVRHPVLVVSEHGNQCSYSCTSLDAFDDTGPLMPRHVQPAPRRPGESQCRW